MKLHYKATGNETIHYYDFTSIYPWTNTYCRYPVGHPTIITNDFKDFSEYFGVAKVTILPHRALYHACLPYVSNQKLKFPLCKKCADTENQNECHCSIHERSITGIWCTPEIQMTISKVYHFEQSFQYDRTGGLFAQSVNIFLKIKQEASEGTKFRHIREYQEKEGITLEYHKIQKNPGLHCLAKLCLNSFWGLID